MHRVDPFSSSELADALYSAANTVGVDCGFILRLVLRLVLLCPPNESELVTLDKIATLEFEAYCLIRSYLL